MNVLRGENRFGFRGQLTLDFPRALAANGGKIVVDADSVTYPIIKKGEKTDKIFKISDIKHLKYDDEEGELEIFLTDDTQITLHAGFFESFERYEEFFALLKK